MIHLYIAYYNQPRPALQSTFGTKNRPLPYQPRPRIWLNFIHNTYSTIHLPPNNTTTNHPILFFPTKFPLSAELHRMPFERDVLQGNVRPQDN